MLENVLFQVLGKNSMIQLCTTFQSSERNNTFNTVCQEHFDTIGLIFRTKNVVFYRVNRMQEFINWSFSVLHPH